MYEIARAYDEFFEERFPFPSEEEVCELEQRIAVDFPPDYREFLLQYNGGYFNEPLIVPPSEETPVDRLTYLDGIQASHPTAELGNPASLAIFDDNEPPEIFPIGGTIRGHLILLVTAQDGDDHGRILLRTFTESFYPADGIAEFFELLAAPNGSRERQQASIDYALSGRR